MKRFKIYPCVFFRGKGVNVAWCFLRIGGHTQWDYIFIDILFWTIRITRSEYLKNENERQKRRERTEEMVKSIIAKF